MTTLYFQRHGIYANPRNIMPLRMPYIALSEEGREQIKELASFYTDKKIAAIYASPMQRIRETVEILAKGLGLTTPPTPLSREGTETPPLEGLSTDAAGRLGGVATPGNIFYEDRLLEVQSPLQGVTIEEYHEIQQGRTLYATSEHRDFCGETLEEIFDRMNSFVMEALRNHEGESIIVASHGDPMMIFSMIKRGIKIDKEVKLQEQATFIPMGGVMQMVIDAEGTLHEFKEINY